MFDFSLAAPGWHQQLVVWGGGATSPYQTFSSASFVTTHPKESELQNMPFLALFGTFIVHPALFKLVRPPHLLQPCTSGDVHFHFPAGYSRRVQVVNVMIVQ